MWSKICELFTCNKKEEPCKEFELFLDDHKIHEKDVLNRLSNIESKIEILEQQKQALTSILTKIEMLIAELKNNS